MLAGIREDIRAVKERDPAARNTAEIVLCYPGLHALWIHRVAHRLYRNKVFSLARFVSHLGRHFTGVEIHPGATIGRRVFIDHGMGVVIGETAEIGDDCLLYKGAVLGGTSLEKKKRHPTLGRKVVVGTNACLLGAITVGDGARIGAGSVVVRPVPPGATVVGVPGRIVEEKGTKEPGVDLDHGRLPDPIQEVVKTMLGIQQGLETRIKRLETEHGIKSSTLIRDADGEEAKAEERDRGE